MPIITQLFSIVLWIIRQVVDFVTDMVFSFWYKNQRKSIPRISNPILMDSAQTLAFKIRTRKVKCVDVILAYIGRIKRVNTVINAVVDNRFEMALREARLVDELVASERHTVEQLAQEFPLLGVPFTIKECFNVKGLRQTGGLVSRRKYVSEVDAPVVAELKKAGAIALAVTNISELCMWWESNNRVYGRTRNPYDTTRTCGGSSGGEASNLAAAGSVIGIGSDVGGSIRIPCSFNGIFGHKPTSGLIANVGRIPELRGEQLDFSVIGPMCRYAGDLLPAFRVLLAGNVDKLRLDQTVEFNKLNVFYMLNDGGSPLVSSVTPEVQTAMLLVVDYLKKSHGIVAKKVAIPELYYSMEIWSSKMKSASYRSFADMLGDGKGPISITSELLKMLLGNSKHTFPAMLFAFGDQLPSRHPETINDLERKCVTLGERFLHLLGDHSVFLYPSVPQVAPYHNQPVFQPFNVAYSAIINMIGFPATQFPVGQDASGLPIGLQVVANRYQDRLTIAFAREMEKAFGGWIPPCPVVK